MRDRLSVMLDSMFTAVDEGLSYDGIVSMPEMGLESFGYRSGLAGLLDDNMELTQTTKATVSRVVTRMRRIFSRAIPSSWARRAVTRKNQNNRLSSVGSDNNGMDRGRPTSPDTPPMQERQTLRNPLAISHSTVSAVPHSSPESLNSSPHRNSQPRRAPTPLHVFPTMPSMQESSNSSPRHSGATQEHRTATQNSPTPQDSQVQTSQDSPATQGSQNRGSRENVRTPRTPLLSQESPTRRTSLASSILAPQEYQVPFTPGFSGSQIAPSPIDVERSSIEDVNVQVRPDPAGELARTGAEQVPRDVAHERDRDTRLQVEGPLPRLQRDREEPRPKGLLPRLQRSREEGEEARPGTSEMSLGGGNEQASGGDQNLRSEQSVGHSPPFAEGPDPPNTKQPRVRR